MVKRPVYNVHPEHLIRWKGTDYSEQSLGGDFGAKPLGIEPNGTMSWAEGAKRGPRNLDDNPALSKYVGDWFRAVAYRLGRYVRFADTLIKARQEALEKSPAMAATARATLATDLQAWRGAVHSARDTELTMRNLVGWAMPKMAKVQPNMSEEEATEAVQLGLVREAVDNQSMLFPGRCEFVPYADGSGLSSDIVMRRDPTWTWATDAYGYGASGRQYFRLDRWPVHLHGDGERVRIEEETQRSALPPTMVDDPVPPIWHMHMDEQRRPIAEEVNARHHPGPELFLSGDTPQQRASIERILLEQIGGSWPFSFFFFLVSSFLSRGPTLIRRLMAVAFAPLPAASTSEMSSSAAARGALGPQPVSLVFSLFWGLLLFFLSLFLPAAFVPPLRVARKGLA